jgi:hypothetical protein
MAKTTPAAPPASGRGPGGRPRRAAWARLRAALPGPADILIYATVVAAVRWWLHIALPVTIAVAVGAEVVVLAATVLAGLARRGRPPHAGDDHGGNPAGGDD